MPYASEWPALPRRARPCQLCALFSLDLDGGPSVLVSKLSLMRWPETSVVDSKLTRPKVKLLTVHGSGTLWAVMISSRLTKDLEKPVRSSLSRSLGQVSDGLFLGDHASESRVEVYEDRFSCVTPESSKNTRPRPAVNALRQVDHDESLSPAAMRMLRNLPDIKHYAGPRREFRTYFVRQSFSWGPLLITDGLYTALEDEEQVSPWFRDTFVHFGSREREVEMVPPRLRHYSLYRADIQSTRTHYECMYGIRFVEPNGRGSCEHPSSQWSLRQTAVHCKYAPGISGTTWVFVTISSTAKERLDAHLSQCEDKAGMDPFEIHTLLLNAAISNWRPYLVDLATEVDDHAAQISGTSPDDRGPVSLTDYSPRQELMALEEKLLNALLVVQATVETMERLRVLSSCNEICSEKHVSCRHAEIRDMLQEQVEDLELVRLQLGHTKTKLQGVTALLSSFLALSSGLALENLARESGRENEEMRKLSQRMHKLAERSTRDSAAVKVLTILTLIYLPTTVVSNFFSTSFVNTQGSGTSSSVVISDDWWIFVAVSLPLTIFTLCIWYIWSRIQAHHSDPRWWKSGRRTSTEEPTPRSNLPKAFGEA